MLDAVPPQGHLAVYDSMDIMLDTQPWSGHASACEALWMGVPVVTLATDRFAGRMVASVLSCAGLGDCIARSREEFVARATSLVSSLDKLRLLRGGLRDTLTASPLCDGARFTRGLESAYRRMWNDCCRKERPNP
jgi:predicted O-linked N-acetylglucosamine transferase (SPINDLY family)